MSYNTPLLTNHLINEGFSPSFTGLAMISVSIAFLISSLKIPSYYSRMSGRVPFVRCRHPCLESLGSRGRKNRGLQFPPGVDPGSSR